MEALKAEESPIWVGKAVMVLGRCFQKFFRKSEPVWNYLSSNKCPDFHELFFNFCFLAARVCGQVSEWLWAVQQDSSRGAPLEIPGKGFTAFHLRNVTKIPQFGPQKRGLISGIDPGIHFQRPWNDSEAWQGSVTAPPSPCELGGGWGRDPPPPPHSGEALEAQTPWESSITFQPHCARCCSIHRGKCSRDPSPTPGWNSSGGCQVRPNKGPLENGEKYGVGPDLWRNFRAHCVPRPRAGVCAAPQWEQLPRSR